MYVFFALSTPDRQGRILVVVFSSFSLFAALNNRNRFTDSSKILIFHNNVTSSLFVFVADIFSDAADTVHLNCHRFD